MYTGNTDSKLDGKFMYLCIYVNICTHTHTHTPHTHTEYIRSHSIYIE